jgi:anti-sigma factor RsiW
MNCAHCEERLSDYLENTLNDSERSVIATHLRACDACSELLAGMRDVLAWGESFPAYEAPPWLATRIIANTPHVVRETWLDTLTAVGRWIIEPRTAIGLLTAVLMIGWLGSMSPVSAADLGSLVRNPTAAYYQAYDGAVRTFYRAPLVTEIRAQLERLREIS